MIEPAVVASLGVVAGGIVAVSARDGRVVAIGLLVAMVAAPLVASPLPESLSVAARIVGAVLAAYLLWASARDSRNRSAGSAIGWAAEGAIATAAFTVGLSVSVVEPLPGPAVAQAGGVALIVLAMVPLVGRDVLRLGVGVTLLVLGCSLLTSAWLGSTPPLAHMAIAVLLVGIVGSASVLAGTKAKAAGIAAGRAAATGIESHASAPGSFASGTRAAAATVRARASRSRERSKGASDQTSVWAQSEEATADTVSAEASPAVASAWPAAPVGRHARPGRPTRPPES